jgi:hypothetical protein
VLVPHARVDHPRAGRKVRHRVVAPVVLDEVREHDAAPFEVDDVAELLSTPDLGRGSVRVLLAVDRPAAGE